jgi:effector-binding domain-containing protein
MSYNCEIKEQASQPTLAIRARAAVQDLPDLLGKCYGNLFGYLAQLKQEAAGPPYTAYYNMDMQDLDVEIGVPVAQELPGMGDIQPSWLPGGKVATCLYIGPYSEMGPAYDAILQFIQENGEQPTGAAYEIYLVADTTQTPVEGLQTLILFPLV